MNITNIAPESSKINPQHSELNSYLQERKIVDKIKDSIYNYFNKKGGKNYDENFEEDMVYDNREDRSMVVERENIENSNKSSFSNDTKHSLSEIKDNKLKEEKVKNSSGKIYDIYRKNIFNFNMRCVLLYSIFVKKKNKVRALAP